MRLLIGFFIVPFFTFGQTVYKGVVIDAKTKLAIPFATVALCKENIGTNADGEGHFTLISWKHLLSDSLAFSCVGYKRKQTLVTDSAYYDIELEQENKELESVTVFSKEKWILEKLNVLSDCGNAGITTDGSHSQVAKYFKSPSPNAILTEIKICKKKFFSSRKAKFRVRIYDMDTITKAPSADLCDYPIEVTSDNKTIVINLEKYKIRLLSEHFFVAIEWLKIPGNVTNFNSIDPNGKEKNYTIYRPSIGGQLIQLSAPYETKMLHEIWQLNYQNRWIPLTPFNNISIVATVKY